MKIIMIGLALLISQNVFAKKKVIYRKSQNVKFDGADIDGVARTPDGSYLLQKRSKKFLPLYKLKNGFNKKIKESVDYLR